MLLILSVCLLPLWPQETVTPVKPLSARIDALIEHKLPAGSNVAISVYDLTAGKPLYGYQADKLSRPASTMKLLTTITALSRPEADEPFRTDVWYQGTIERDTLQGNMYVIGGIGFPGGCRGPFPLLCHQRQGVWRCLHERLLVLGQRLVVG